MKVVDFIIVVCCSVVVTTNLSHTNMKSASVMFYQVDLKPSNLNRTAVKGGRRHKTECTNICLDSADCLTTVFDEDLGQCSMYNSTTMVETLSNGETAHMKDLEQLEVTCMALTYNQEVGSCVQLFTTPKTFEDAEADCQRLHERSHLVTITDDRKQQALNRLADSVGVTKYLTGARATYPESDTYVWIATGEELSYTNWHDSQPNNNGGLVEDCVNAVKLSNDFKWHDYKCNGAHAYICEVQ